MKIAVFTNGETVIVVGLDVDDQPIDTDGTLFGPESGRCLEDFDRIEFNPDRGEIVIVKPFVDLSVR